MNKTLVANKWQVRLVVLLVFLLGFIAGALALSAYQKRYPGGETRYSSRRQFERVIDDLQLTGDQRQQVEKILGDMRAQLMAVRKESLPRYGEIRQQADLQLQLVLSAEQWAQFEKARNEMRSRWRRDRAQ